jgi:hypothetical protein
MIIRKSKHEYRVSLGNTSLASHEQLHEAIKWCREIYGPGGRNTKHKWRYGWVNREKNLFYFRSEQDALFFTLRWL